MSTEYYYINTSVDSMRCCCEVWIYSSNHSLGIYFRFGFVWIVHCDSFEISIFCCSNENYDSYLEVKYDAMSPKNNWKIMCFSSWLMLMISSCNLNVSTTILMERHQTSKHNYFDSLKRIPCEYRNTKIQSMPWIYEKKNGVKHRTPSNDEVIVTELGFVRDWIGK